MRSLTIVAWCGFLTAVLPFLAVPIAYKIPAYAVLGIVACALSIMTRLRYLHFVEEHEELRAESEARASGRRDYPLDYPADVLTEESNA